MKFIVDKLPANPRSCIFSTWRPLPPICEEAGYYKCIKCDKECNLSNSKECYMLKEKDNE